MASGAIMASRGHGRVALHGAPMCSSHNTAQASTNTSSHAHDIAAPISSSSSASSSHSGSNRSTSTEDSDPDREELPPSDHHKSCDGEANHRLHYRHLSNNSLLPSPFPFGGASAMPSTSLCSAKMDHPVVEGRQRPVFRSRSSNSGAAKMTTSSNAPNSNKVATANISNAEMPPPLTLERAMSMRDYHVVEMKISKRTKSSDTEGLQKPSWEEEVRQALARSSLSGGDGGSRRCSNVKDSNKNPTLGSGSLLQRSATVREHGSSHAFATALLPQAATTKQSLASDDTDHFLKIKLPSRAPPLPKVSVKRSTWSKVRSPGEQRWEEAEEFEMMMERGGSNHHHLQQQQQQQQRSSVPRLSMAKMRSQSMRVWNKNPQKSHVSGFYEDFDEQLEGEEEVEDAGEEEEEWRSNIERGAADGSVYGAEPGRRSVGSYRYPGDGATLAPPPGMMVMMGRSSSLRDPAIGMVMECGACGAPMRHRPPCCRLHHHHHHHHCCPEGTPCCQPQAGSLSNGGMGKKKASGSSAAGSVLRAWRRLLGLAKKSPAHDHAHVHHNNSNHHHHHHHHLFNTTH